IRFLGGTLKDPLRLRGERYLLGRRDALLEDGLAPDLLPNAGRRHLRQRKDSRNEALHVARQAEEDVLRFDRGGTQLGGLDPREEERAPCGFGESFEHGWRASAAPHTIASTAAGRKFIDANEEKRAKSFVSGRRDHG